MPSLTSPVPDSSAAIAVVIVNYGTAELAAEAVRSVLNNTHAAFNIEVHLVDNASPDGDALALQKLHKEERWAHSENGPVTIYAENENHGFGRGNNVALHALAARENPPDYVLLLNPDAQLQPGALETLATFLNTHSDVGCVGAQISKPTEGPVTAAFRFPSAKVEFVSAANLNPLTRLMGGGTMWMSPDLPTQQVDWVAGAAVMFRMKALEEAGFFDPDFFLYFEEVELIWRLAQHGWPCWYVQEAHVIHHEGAATDVRSGSGARKRRPAYWYQSQAMYFRKTASPIRATGRAFARLAGALIHRGASLLRGRQPDLPKSYFKDYMRHTFLPVLTAKDLSNNADLPTGSQAQHDIDTNAPKTAAINDGKINRNPHDIGFWSLIAEDFRTHDRDLFAQGFWALFWHRFGNLRMSAPGRILRSPLTLLYWFGSKSVQWFCGMDLPYTVVVGRRVKLEHFGGMILVARAIGNDVILRQNTTLGIKTPTKDQARPTIGDGVDIGVGAAILGDISIGRNTVIAANAAVVHDCPADVLMAGAPARIKKKSDKPTLQKMTG